MDDFTIGESLRFYREKAGLSQEELCSLIGINSRSTIKNWEMNISSPDAKMIQKISDVLNVRIEDLFSGIGKSSYSDCNNAVGYGADLIKYIQAAGDIDYETAELCREAITDMLNNKNKADIVSYPPAELPIFLSYKNKGYFEIKEKIKDLQTYRRKNHYSSADIYKYLTTLDTNYAEHLCVLYIIQIFNGAKIPSELLYSQIRDLVIVPKSEVPFFEEASSREVS